MQCNDFSPSERTLEAFGGAGSPKPGASGLGLDSVSTRKKMVQQLMTVGGIRSVAVLGAMGLVERHHFVQTALANRVYQDVSLPIGHGQTISKPSAVARMLDLLLEVVGVAQGRVLEIGTGCGYQAALLAQLCKEVYSIERIADLHKLARRNVRALRLKNLHLLFRDGMLGYAAGAPYAGIISAAGGLLPPAWLEQLAVGGRLVAPVVQPGGRQALVVIDRQSNGFTQALYETVHFVPLKSGIYG